jgi:hypothetical protein
MNATTTRPAWALPVLEYVVEQPVITEKLICPQLQSHSARREKRSIYMLSGMQYASVTKLMPPLMPWRCTALVMPIVLRMRERYDEMIPLPAH